MFVIVWNSSSMSSSRCAAIMRRALIIIVASLALVLADEDGRYQGDNSGQYVPSDGDDGRYIPDDSGRYFHDGSGLYADDGSGKYKEILDRYRHQGGGRGGGGGGSGGGGGGGFPTPNAFKFSNKPASRPKINARPPPSFTPNLILVDANDLGKQSHTKFSPTAKPNKAFDLHYNAGSSFGNSPSGTSHQPARHVVAERAFPQRQGKYDDSRWRIIRQSGDVGTDGYHWDYETENGIIAEESGKLANKGTDLEAMRAKGFFKYTGPDNVVYQVTYTADENGFVPKGNHLPTPPPIPAAILKSLELQKAAGKF